MAIACTWQDRQKIQSGTIKEDKQKIEQVSILYGVCFCSAFEMTMQDCHPYDLQMAGQIE